MTSKKISIAELRRRATERLKERERRRGQRPEENRTATETQRLIQELQIHQIELEMQNEELQKSRAEVETLLAQYTDLYDFAPVGYFTLGRDGTIRRANLTGAALLSEERARLMNRRLELFVSKEDRPPFSYFLEKVFTKEAAPSSERAACEVTLDPAKSRPPVSEAQGQHGSGPASRQVRIEAAVTEDGQECRAVMMDITRRRQAEAAFRESHARLERNLKGAIDVISETIDRKGPYAPGHHRRVAALASAIARKMGLTDFQVQGIELAAAVYDIGLIHIPFEFLQDTDRLDGLKLALYRGYPQTGYDALKKLEFPWPIADIVLQHRECFDGSGFPQGLKGADILIEARVLAVADAVVDLTAIRVYRNALPLEKAQESILKDRGSRFDPAVIEACLQIFREGFSL